MSEMIRKDSNKICTIKYQAVCCSDFKFLLKLESKFVKL